MEAFTDTLPRVCNGFKEDNIVSINRTWNRSAGAGAGAGAGASNSFVTENNTPHDKVILPLPLHKRVSNFQSLC